MMKTRNSNIDTAEAGTSIRNEREGSKSECLKRRSGGRERLEFRVYAVFLSLLPGIESLLLSYTVLITPGPRRRTGRG